MENRHARTLRVALAAIATCAVALSTACAIPVKAARDNAHPVSATTSQQHTSSTLSPGVTEMLMTSAGNLTITGQLVTGGPSCSSGCDRVFDPDYELLSISDHADKMWTNKHLPAIGPTEPSKPVNISDQFGNMLNELETAHIYIAQQHESIEQLSDEKETLRLKVNDLESRLTDLEALLSR